MKNILRTFAIMLFLGSAFNITSFAQLNGDYVIGTGQTYTTLGAAITALNSVGASGTVRFLIDENLLETGSPMISSATLNGTNTLVIKPNTGKTPTVTFSGCVASGNNAYSGLTINGGSAAVGYVTIDGSNTTGGTTRDLTFRLNDATAGRYIINAVGNADYVIVKNCKFFFDAIMDQSVSANRGAGVRSNGTGTTITIDYLTIQNNEIGTETVAAGYGILINNAASTYSSNVSILDNIVYGSTVPINTLRANTGTSSSLNITGNTVSLIGFDTPLGYSMYGIWIDQSSNVVNILKNKIVKVNGYNNSTTTYPLYAIFCGRQNAGSTLNIVNNFIGNFSWQGTFTASNISAIRLAGTTASTYYIYYNSINLNGDNLNGITGNVVSFDLVSANSIVSLKNNIIVNGSNTTSSYAISSPTTTNLTSDYNDLYVPGANANVGSYNGVAQQTLANWQSASGQDANSKSKAVNFFSVNDLHLAGSSLGDADLLGTPIIGITSDIDGDLRLSPPNGPYMGADEGNIPLPIELAAFTASVKNNSVKLVWKTSMEVNSSKFVVQRESENKEWIKIGEVIASGNSNSPKDYNFTDESLVLEKYLYRLKMIDADGSYRYSNTIEVEICLPSEYALSQNYPNPFNPSTKIDYQLPFDSRVTIEIFNITGEKIATLLENDLSAGYYTTEINAASLNLSSGIYIYRLAANNQNFESYVQVRKLMLMK